MNLALKRPGAQSQTGRADTCAMRVLRFLSKHLLTATPCDHQARWHVQNTGSAAHEDRNQTDLVQGHENKFHTITWGECGVGKDAKYLHCTSDFYF